MLPNLENYLPVHDNHFAYRLATGCIDAITLLKYTVVYYNSQRPDVYCARVDHSKLYDITNNSLLCDKMRETDSPGQVIALIDFMGKKTSVCTSYGGQLSDEGNVKSGVQQGGISSRMLFNFYIN